MGFAVQEAGRPIRVGRTPSWLSSLLTLLALAIAALSIPVFACGCPESSPTGSCACSDHSADGTCCCCSHPHTAKTASLGATGQKFGTVDPACGRSQPKLATLETPRTDLTPSVAVLAFAPCSYEIAGAPASTPGTLLREPVPRAPSISSSNLRL